MEMYVNTRLNLMEADPENTGEIRESSAHVADSALHVAALRGKVEFVEKIANLMPSLATERNQKGMIPLHLASLKGDVETVKELLKAKVEDDHDGVKLQCLAKDDHGWNPPSTIFIRNTKLTCGCIKKFLFESCPGQLAFMFLILNTIIFVVVSTLSSVTISCSWLSTVVSFIFYFSSTFYC